MLNKDIPEAERIAKAKALLSEAGYKGEPVVLLDPVNRPTFHSANLVFSEALKKAGIACLEHSAARGKWDLLWILTPKMLRQLAE